MLSEINQTEKDKKYYFTNRCNIKQTATNYRKKTNLQIQTTEWRLPVGKGVERRQSW